MSDASDGDQYHFDPVTYLEMIREEVPAYDEFQDAVAAATAGLRVERVLELGVGTGETARRVLDLHPAAELIGIDESADMLARRLSRSRGRPAGGPPRGPAAGGAASISSCQRSPCTTSTAPARRTCSPAIAERLRPGGRFVLGDVVVPEDPADVVTPIDGVYDQPSTVVEQLEWLGAAGLPARVAWTRQDLAVLVGVQGADGGSRS